eukprot:9577082-Prorocentrum_lima.AAC.1
MRASRQGPQGRREAGGGCTMRVESFNQTRVQLLGNCASDQRDVLRGEFIRRVRKKLPCQH